MSSDQPRPPLAPHLERDPAELSRANAMASSASAPVKEVVIIERQDGHWSRHLIAPLLILGIAGWITAFRPNAPEWPNLEPTGTQVVKNDSDGDPASDPKADAVPPEPTGDVNPDPNPANPVDPPRPDAALEWPPKPEHDPIPVGFLPPDAGDAGANESALDSDQAPIASPEAGSMEEIEKLRKEIARQEDFKRAAEPLPPVNRNLTPQQIDKERRDNFRQTLRQALIRKNVSRERMAQEIQLLAAANRGGISDEVKSRATRLLNSASVRRASAPSTAQIVASLRQVGVPEPMLLEYLHSKEVNRIGARSGPRDASDAWIKAARELIVRN